MQWSPEQIASRMSISLDTLYRHVCVDKGKGGDHWKNLRGQKQMIKCYAGGRDKRGQITSRRPLSERPLHIEARRKMAGHWACDTVIGASYKGVVVTMLERKSGYAVLAKVVNKTTDLASSAIVSNLKPYSERFKTLTYDSAKEFVGYSLFVQELNSTAYFERQFASWEYGSNDNLNDLLRQYIPNKRAMSTVSDDEIKMIKTD